MTPGETFLVESLAVALALLETVAVEGLTPEHRATIEQFLAAMRHTKQPAP
jgi:hypothetical protein